MHSALETYWSTATEPTRHYGRDVPWMYSMTWPWLVTEEGGILAAAGGIAAHVER